MISLASPDGIIIFAHGSRDPLWRGPLEAVAQRIRQDAAQALVACAYLELCEPSLPDAVSAMIERLQKTPDLIALRADSIRASGLKRLKIRVVPMFLGMGKHAREDLPQLAAALRLTHPAVEFEIAQTIGEDERVISLLAQIAAM
jgi:sirohydrochlorin cobaltochelatase